LLIVTSAILRGIKQTRAETWKIGDTAVPFVRHSNYARLSPNIVGTVIIVTGEAANSEVPDAPLTCAVAVV